MMRPGYLVILCCIGILCGCGGPGIQQLQTEITSAVGQIDPSTDGQALAAYRKSVQQSVAGVFQKAAPPLRPDLLLHCESLAAERFQLIFVQPTIAEGEKSHFLAALGGMQQAIWAVDQSWGNQCLQRFLPSAQQQAEWLQDESSAVPRVRSCLAGLQVSHGELQQVSGRAVSQETTRQLIDSLLGLAFRSQTMELRSEIISGLLEHWAAERPSITRMLDQRLQTGDDALALAVYSKYSADLQLSVPLAVLRQKMQAAAEIGDAQQLLLEIAGYEERAGQLGVSASGAIQQALDTATRRQMAVWMTDEDAANQLSAVLRGVVSGHPQMATELQTQIAASVTEQLQTLLTGGDLPQLTAGLQRAEKLGLSAETVRGIAEQLTSAETADAGRLRLRFAAAVPTTAERTSLVRSVLTRNSLSLPVLQAALQVPQTSAEWVLLTELLRQQLPAAEVTAEDLFVLGIELRESGARSVILAESFRRKAPGASWLRAMTEVDFEESEISGLQAALEGVKRDAVADTVPAVDAQTAIELLRAARQPAFARLVLSQVPATTEWTLPQLRQLLEPAPVQGLEQFLQGAATRALEAASAAPNAETFPEALEFYERYRELLQLSASPALVEAAFTNTLTGDDPAKVVTSVRNLAGMPALLNSQNGQQLADYLLRQLQARIQKKQSPGEPVSQLLKLLSEHFPDQCAAVAMAWQAALLTPKVDLAVLKQHLQTGLSTKLLEVEEFAGLVTAQLQRDSEAAVTVEDFERCAGRLRDTEDLFAGMEAAAPVLAAQRAGWTQLVTERLGQLQQDYQGLTDFLRVVDVELQREQYQQSALRLLELSPLDDKQAINRDCARYLKLNPQQPAAVSLEAGRRLLRHAVAVRNWSLAEQQLKRLQVGGNLDATEQAFESSLRNVFFATELARSWQGRRIPIHVQVTFNGELQQLNIDLQLQEIAGEEVRGITSTLHLKESGKFSGRISESGLELRFTEESMQTNFTSTDTKESLVRLTPASVRSSYNDVEFSGMDAGGRLLVSELPNGDMVFLDLPRNRVPLKPYWDGAPWRNLTWFIGPLLDEKGQLFFQTAEFLDQGIDGHSLTFTVADFTDAGPVTLHGDIFYIGGSPTPITRTPSVELYRNAELAPFATETVRLQPYLGTDSRLGRFLGRQRIVIQVPRGTRKLILKSAANRSARVMLNGVSLTLPEASNASPSASEP